MDVASLFSESPQAVSLGCFQSTAGTNDAAATVLSVFLGTCIWISVGRIPRTGITGSKGMKCVILMDVAKVAPERLYQFVLSLPGCLMVGT